jgi:hypothetical protein
VKNVKKILLPLLIAAVHLGNVAFTQAESPTSAHNRQHRRYHTINALANTSGQEVLFESAGFAGFTVEGSAKFKKPLIIPFTSTEQYHYEFALDNPYIPPEALMIKTLQGSFGMWEHEGGIVSARVYERGYTSVDDCKETTLVKAHLLHASKAAVLGFLLLVNQAGELHLKPLGQP